MADPVRYGIVGCAGVGNNHARAALKAEGAELVACADISEEAAAEFAEEYEVPATYANPAEMVEDAEIDAVSVCTPSGTHAQVTTSIANAGAHVLCEKPLEIYADRMNEMIETCDEAGVKLGGIFQRRMDPGNRRARRAVQDGELGEPILGDATIKWFRPQSYYDSAAWRGTRDMDGGCMMNQGIHHIDTLQWIMGGVESVIAVTDTLSREMECEDTAALVVRFDNGAVGTIEATTAVKGGQDRMEINGTEGSIALDGREITDFQIGTGEESRYSAETESVETEGDHHPCGINHDGLVQDFVVAIQEDREPEIPGHEAREAVDIILAAYQSSETGERVYLEDLRS